MRSFSFFSSCWFCRTDAFSRVFPHSHTHIHIMRGTNICRVVSYNWKWPRFTARQHRTEARKLNWKYSAFFFARYITDTPRMYSASSLYEPVSFPFPLSPLCLSLFLCLMASVCTRERQRARETMRFELQCLANRLSESYRFQQIASSCIQRPKRVQRSKAPACVRALWNNENIRKTDRGAQFGEERISRVRSFASKANRVLYQLYRLPLLHQASCSCAQIEYVSCARCENTLAISNTTGVYSVRYHVR